jgi:hypothetical protein
LKKRKREEKRERQKEERWGWEDSHHSCEAKDIILLGIDMN